MCARVEVECSARIKGKSCKGKKGCKKDGIQIVVGRNSEDLVNKEGAWFSIVFKMDFQPMLFDVYCSCRNSKVRNMYYLLNQCNIS